MDYSKVKFVTPSVGCKYLTKGKVYAVSGESPHGLPEIINDEGEVAIIRIDRCAHLNGAHWIPCHEDGTPLTNELTALEVEMLDILNRISGELLRADFVLSEKWYDIITETIKKAKQ